MPPNSATMVEADDERSTSKHASDAHLEIAQDFGRRVSFNVVSEDVSDMSKNCRYLGMPRTPRQTGMWMSRRCQYQLLRLPQERRN